MLKYQNVLIKIKITPVNDFKVLLNTITDYEEKKKFVQIGLFGF